MTMEKKSANPGVPQGNELIQIGKSFGGWASNPPGGVTPPHYIASVEGVQGALAKQQANQYAESDGVTLFSTEKFGHLAAAQIFAGVTDSDINDLPLNAVVTSQTLTDGVCVLNNGRLIRFDPSTPAYTHGNKYDPVARTAISSGSAKGNDLILFRDTLIAGITEWVVWSYDYAGSADIAICKANNFLTNTDEFWSGMSGQTGWIAMTPLVPHKLAKGPDGNIYFTDGHAVQQITLANNVALNTTNAVVALRLDVGPGWIVTGICPYKNYVAVIASSKSSNVSRGETRVFLWDGKSSTVNGVTSTAAEFIYDIPDNFGQGIYFDGNILYAVTSGRNNSSKIFELTGKGFVPVFESGLLGASVTPLQGSLENYQYSLMIGGVKNGTAAHLYRFYSGGFHDEGQLSDGSNLATDIGMVKNLYANQLTCGVKYGSTYAIFGNKVGTYQPGAVMKTILFTQGILGRRQYPLGFKGTVNRIIIYLSQWGIGASLSLGLFKDYLPVGAGIGSANDLLNLLIDTDATNPNTINHKMYPVGTTEIDISDIAITDVSTFYMLIQFSHALATNTAAIIRDAVVYWSPSQ